MVVVQEAPGAMLDAHVLETRLKPDPETEAEVGAVTERGPTPSLESVEVRSVVLPAARLPKAMSVMEPDWATPAPLTATVGDPALAEAMVALPL